MDRSSVIEKLTITYDEDADELAGWWTDTDCFSFRLGMIGKQLI